jgi:hypothetical protein
VSLEDRILDHRAMYQADLHVGRLVSRQPPTSLDLNTGVLEQEPAAAVGMTMSGALLRRLGHPEGYGAAHPWMKALWLTRSWCRRQHRRRYHSVERQWDGALCQQMVRFVVIRGWSVQNAGLILDYTDPETILRESFDYIETTIDDFRRKAEQRQRESEGHALTCACGHSWSRHDNPVTMFACATCECSRYRAEDRRAA